MISLLNVFVNAFSALLTNSIGFFSVRCQLSPSFSISTIDDEPLYQDVCVGYAAVAIPQRLSTTDGYFSLMKM